jgi:putative SOS response-associated peptidase YedK
MCGRVTLHSPADVLRQRFRVQITDDVPQRYNIRPSEALLTVSTDRDGARRLLPMRFGFIPFWEKQPSTRLSTINARAETLQRSAIYRRALERRRCLVIADGFYEWKPAPGGRKGAKQPYWIHRADAAPFAFAGLYSIWRPQGDRDAPPLLSCAIVTTAARGALEAIHARMPVILQTGDEEAWIDRGVQDGAALEPILAAAEVASLQAHPVSLAVNARDSEGPELIRPEPRDA